jgi:ComF family protein
MYRLSVQELKRGFIHLFYPRICEGCNKPLLTAETILCLSCDAQLPQTAYHHIPDNETALRFAGRIPFSYATTFAYFTNEGLLQHLLHGLKYGGKKEIGYFLGTCLGNAIKSTGWANEIDLIIPVPLHPAKEAKRGYNQSLLIARGIGDVLQKPVAADVLIRTRDTESQTRKTRTERVDNMTAAFRLDEQQQLAGKHILICDDVLTTGATIEACALALQTAENIKISIATIGIAVS